MTMKRRIEALEVAHHRRILARVAPPGRADDLLELAICFLEQPPEQQRADMRGYSASEWAEINSWLPALHRARWAGR